MNALNLGINNQDEDHDHEVHDGGEGPRHSHEEPQPSNSSWDTVITKQLKRLHPGHSAPLMCM